MTVKRTQVGIIGAGPTGLLLPQRLMEQGITPVILEVRDRGYIENRIRARVQEDGTVELLTETKADHQLRQKGQMHEGIEISINGSVQE